MATAPWGGDLSGMWRATPADEDLRRRITEGGLEPDGWDLLAVPGHWRDHPAFADCDGPVLHHHRFASPGLLDGSGPGGAPTTDPAIALDERRHWLVLDGIFYQSDLWLDGTYLGDTEGYFFPHSFEVTDPTRERSEHELVVEVACAPQRDRKAKRNLTGVFQHWDCLDPDGNPGGIWRPVRLEQSGPVRIRHFRAICRDADEQTATIAVRAVLDTTEAGPVTLRTRVADTERELVHHLAAGENRVEWTVAVAEPVRWWPWSLGSPTLHDLDVAVLLEDGRLSDRRHRRIGLRSVERKRWVFTVNGERLYLKGTNLAPTRALLGRATPPELARDVTLAREAGLDFVRVHAHITRPELYEAADEAGMLVWQDLPLQWGYARTVRRQARRQAREAVDLLGHHPSVFQWCGHNEPMAIDVTPEKLADPRGRARLAVRGLRAQVLPSWNRSVLDLSIARVLERTDGSRPVVAHSGVLPHFPQLDGTDSHLYFGWYHGESDDLPRFGAAWPRMVRFVTEFGAQAVPHEADFCEPDRWPDLDWEHLGHTHGLQKFAFDRYVPPADHPTFQSWAEATRAYQAQLVRRQVETLRRLKYHPTGGFAHFLLTDAHPAVSWAVLDHERRPKPAYGALRAACAPVIVVADPLPGRLRAGAALELAVHVVSDRRIALDDMVTSAHLSWVRPDGAGDGAGEEVIRRWTWTGDVPADSCVRVGVVQATVPTPPGPGPRQLRLHLELTGAGEHATNDYHSPIGVD